MKTIIRNLTASMVPFAVSVLTQAFAQNVTFSVNSYGLQNIAYNGFTFLNGNAMGLSRITAPGATNTPTTIVSHIIDTDQSGTLMTYPWGSIHMRYQATGNKLSITATLTNSSPSNISDIELYLMNLIFPSSPPQYDGSHPLLFNSCGDPPVMYLSYSNGALVFVNENLTQPLSIGATAPLNRPTNTIFAMKLISGIDTSLPYTYYGLMPPVPPNSNVTYSVSLRFGAGSLDPTNLASDIYSQFSAMYPSRINWVDRRALGMDVLGTLGYGSTTNPRGWFNHPNADYVSPTGMAQFRTDLLARGKRDIAVLRSLNAQGIMIWDIEGEEFPVSYYGDPRHVPLLAPEMDAVADEFIQQFKDAGFRVGMTIRPDSFQAGTNLPGVGTNGHVFVLTTAPFGQKEYLYTNGAWSQTNVNSQNLGTNYPQDMLDKISYANSRWGVSMFYIDSYPAIPPYYVYAFSNILQTYPDVLLIPEHNNTAYFSVTAPYITPQLTGYGTPWNTFRTYPGAFSVQRIYSPWNTYSNLVACVQEGDILLINCWFKDANTTNVIQAYNNSGIGFPPVPPTDLHIITNAP